MSVRLVVTEHDSYVTPSEKRRYEAAAKRLERASGDEVRIQQYRDVTDLAGERAVVLSGSFAPWAAHDGGDLERLGDTVARSGLPALGICAGMQLFVEWAGGEIGRAREPERGFVEIEVVDDGDLFAGVEPRPRVYQHHTDEVVRLPNRVSVLARSPTCRVQAIAVPERRWWGTQFHPERAGARHPAGERVLRNFFELATG